jgi:hypothetical protein
VLACARHIACVFERLPGAFEKDALLRVYAFGLARCKSEECCVEHFSIGQDAAGVDKVRLIQRRRIDARHAQLTF